MVSLIVVNFNTAQLTADCLSSLLDNVPEADREIIVVDNASADDSLSVFRAAFGNKIKLIANAANLGFAAANNIGARAANGDILFFLNSDTIIKSDITKPLAAIFAASERIGIVSPTLLLPSEQPQPFAFGLFPSLASLAAQKLFPSRSFRSSSGLKYVDWVSGAALAIRKEVFEKIGAWDEGYFLYFEDVDLCWRAKHYGYEVVVTASISVTHLGGRSLERDRQRKDHYYRAQEYFFRKNYGALSASVLKIIRWPYKILKELHK